MSAHFNDIDQKLVSAMREVSLSMFRKNFFGIFHGSISARLTYNQFVINRRQAVFDNINQHSLIVLNTQPDYRWNEASVDATIHSQIYQQYKNAKFIAYAMPPHSVAYSLKHDKIHPIDFFGKQILGDEIEIWDPQNYDTWYQRASQEISAHIAKNNKKFLVVKGYGVYAFDRDLHALAKKIALVENTCKILHLMQNAMIE
ncbi:hypothetical protein BBW65_06815 [Helicobacter enhydrae]|uniref:Class II aldolase/adducin N-terminal domain-containing protein n=1 Tax=Helicobacter enhydrae TaxID=222136 RepID=A0A1B1U745_9HELI|nr:class II aldolase and adducin N-terminal domain-containing protein [Helicobacter enhydrae]ANV98522.1 hypothetical protein BBW65_06815 [Helicobacter enhydrae]